MGMLGEEEGLGRGHDAPLIKKNDIHVVPDSHPASLTSLPSSFIPLKQDKFSDGLGGGE